MNSTLPRRGSPLRIPRISRRKGDRQTSTRSRPPLKDMALRWYPRLLASFTSQYSCGSSRSLGKGHDRQLFGGVNADPCFIEVHISALPNGRNSFGPLQCRETSGMACQVAHPAGVCLPIILLVSPAPGFLSSWVAYVLVEGQRLRANWSSISRRKHATKEEVRWRKSMAALLFSSAMRLGIAWIDSHPQFLSTGVISASFPVYMCSNE